MSLERDARRFQQIAALEREWTVKQLEIGSAKAHIKELEREAEGIFLRLRAAARDEGELPGLPLFDRIEVVHVDA